MKNTAILTLLLLAASSCVLIGCKDKKIDWGYVAGRKEPPPDELVDQMLTAKDPDTRRIAIDKLAKTDWINDPKHQDLVAQLAKPSAEPSPIVRSAAIRVISRINRQDFLPIIEAGLKDKSETVRYDCADFFIDHKYDPAMVELQRLALDDEYSDVRTAAARALSHYRNNSAYRTLLRCLDDESFEVRNAAHDSLVAMTGVDHGRDPTAWLQDPSKLGKETLPAKSETIYRKRPWWDWCKITKESVQVKQGSKTNFTDELQLPPSDINDLNPVRVEDRNERKVGQ